MLDVTLLSLLRTRSRFEQVRAVLDADRGFLDKTTADLLRAYGEYFDAFPEHAEIKIRVFHPRLMRTVYRHASQEEQDGVTAVLKTVWSATPDECTTDTVMREMNEAAAHAEAQALLLQWAEGDLPGDLVTTLQAMADRRATAVGALTKASLVPDDMQDILGDEMNDAGLKFRLSSLRKSMRGLRPGDFGILAARPDQGKTTLTASEVTYLAAQMQPGQKVYWLNNEGPGRRLWPRIYGAALDATTEDLLAMQAAGVLYDRYAEAVGGRDRIEVHDVHGWAWPQVQSFIMRRPNSLFVFDMLANVTMPGADARQDLRLEKLFAAAREMMCRADSIGIATMQVSAEGDGQQFPPMAALKDSKTGVQGACDFIAIMGSVPSDPGLRDMRYIGIPKNKMRRAGAPGDPQEPARLDAARSRVKDIPIGE